MNGTKFSRKLRNSRVSVPTIGPAMEAAMQGRCHGPARKLQKSSTLFCKMLAKRHPMCSSAILLADTTCAYSTEIIHMKFPRSCSWILRKRINTICFLPHGKESQLHSYSVIVHRQSGHRYL